MYTCILVQVDSNSSGCNIEWYHVSHDINAYQPAQSTLQLYNVVVVILSHGIVWVIKPYSFNLGGLQVTRTRVQADTGASDTYHDHYRRSHELHEPIATCHK